MSNSVTWKDKALQQAERLGKDDPEGIQQVFNSADMLANNPRPPGSTGGSTTRRIHIGVYRLWYSIADGPPVVVSVEHLGYVS